MDPRYGRLVNFIQNAESPADDHTAREPMTNILEVACPIQGQKKTFYLFSNI